MQSNHKSFKFFVIPNPDILWLKLAIGKGLEWFWNGGLTTDMWNSWKGAQLDSGRWIYKLCGYSSSLGSLWSTRTKMEMTTMTAIHTVEDSLNDPSSPAFHLPDQVWSTRPSEYFPGLRAFQNWVVGAHITVPSVKENGVTNQKLIVAFYWVLFANLDEIADPLKAFWSDRINELGSKHWTISNRGR